MVRSKWKRWLIARWRLGTLFWFRRLFHWSYSGVVIPFLWGTGLAMVGLGLSTLVPPEIFNLAYSVFFLAFTHTLGWWLTSDALRRLNPKLWNMTKRKRSNVPMAQRFYRTCQVAICLFLIGSLWYALRETSIVKFNKDNTSLDGELISADIPDLPGYNDHDPCRIGKDMYVVYLEHGFSLLSSNPPSVIFSDDATKQPIAWITKKGDGSIELSIDIRSEDNDLILRMEKNVYHISPTNFFQMSRGNVSRDKSTLSITDKKGNEALMVRYINKHAFLIRARLMSNGRSLDTSQLRWFNSCLINNNNGNHFIGFWLENYAAFVSFLYSSAGASMSFIIVSRNR